MTKLEKAFELFDNYNRQDPRKITWNGSSFPMEYFYAEQLYRWVINLVPNASERLLLASRCQHIGRWQVPRDAYPEGKAGYLNWRTSLAKFHAEKAEELMLQAGYEPNFTLSVKEILLKKHIKSDEEMQVMENALCLVFLQFQLHDFISEHDDDKLVRILQKSWNKMSEPGRTAALQLSFGDREKMLIEKALTS